MGCCWDSVAAVLRSWWLGSGVVVAHWKQVVLFCFFFLLCGDLVTGSRWCCVVASSEMGSWCVLGGLGGGQWSLFWPGGNLLGFA